MALLAIRTRRCTPRILCYELTELGVEDTIREVKRIVEYYRKLEAADYEKRG